MAQCPVLSPGRFSTPSGSGTPGTPRSPARASSDVGRNVPSPPAAAPRKLCGSLSTDADGFVPSVVTVAVSGSFLISQGRFADVPGQAPGGPGIHAGRDAEFRPGLSVQPPRSRWSFPPLTWERGDCDMAHGFRLQPTLTLPFPCHGSCEGAGGGTRGRVWPPLSHQHLLQPHKHAGGSRFRFLRL